MSRIRSFAGAAALALLLAAPGAWANDSTAELTTGGLVMKKDPAIEMRSEDLFVSVKEIRVAYRFANTSAADVSVTVAFPMPDITIEGEDDLSAVPTESATNFLDFRTTVDGRPVTAQVEQKVIKDGVDRTAYLRGLGIPLAPHLPSTNKIVDGLPQAKKDELIRLGLAQIMEYDDGHGWEKHTYATWTLKTTWYWSQTFPAGKEIVVQHRYKPSVGNTAGTQFGSPYGHDEPQYSNALKHYCVDADFLAAIERAKTARKAEYPPFYEERIEYILTTGANWKAPIGDFRLVVDKEDPRSLLSFCAEGVRKISPTQFEVRRTNFTPTKDLSILFLRPGGAEYGAQP